MSIPLVEIKVHMIDLKLFFSTIIERNWPIFEKCRAHPDPQILGDLVSKSLWWVLVVHLTGLPCM